MKYLFSNPICRKWHSMKRVRWCLSSISRVSSLSTELSLNARDIVSHLFKKRRRKKKTKVTLGVHNKNILAARYEHCWLI